MDQTRILTRNEIARVLADLRRKKRARSFCSHMLAAGRTLAEVRDAAGHSNVATTSIYLHAATSDDEGPIPTVFG